MRYVKAVPRLNADRGPGMPAARKGQSRGDAEEIRLSLAAQNPPRMLNVRRDLVGIIPLVDPAVLVEDKLE